MLARLLGVFHVRLATPEIHFNGLYVQCETFTFDVYVCVCVCVCRVIISSPWTLITVRFIDFI